MSSSPTKPAAGESIRSYRFGLLVVFTILLLLSNTNATTSVDRILHHVPTVVDHGCQ